MAKDPKLEKMEAIFKMVNDSLTKEEFIKAFKVVVDMVQEADKQNEQNWSLMEKALDDLSEKVKKGVEEDVDSLKMVLEDFLNEQAMILFKKHDSLKDGKDGKDGRDGKNGRDGIDGEDGQDGKDGERGPRGERGPAGKEGTTYRVGWGAHPLQIQGLGIVIDKNTRVINFKGPSLTSVTRLPNGVVEVTIGGGGTGYVGEEVPTDSGNHTNFTLAHTPIPGTLRVFRGGARQQSIGATPDFSSTGTSLILVVPLNTAGGEVLMVDYQY